MSRLIPALAAALLAAAGASAAAQGAPSLAHRLDSIAGAEVRANRSVGISAAAVRGNDRLLLQAYGKADVEGNVPMAVGTMVPIGSVAKQFTAAAILQLRDQGKLGLDDEVTKWLPELDTRGNRITLRHLLAHTAGIVELGDMPELRAIRLMRNPTVSRDSVYRRRERHAPHPAERRRQGEPDPAVGDDVLQRPRRFAAHADVRARRGWQGGVDHAEGAGGERTLWKLP